MTKNYKIVWTIMVNNCGICLSGITRTKPPVFCDVCKKQFHTSCISKQIDILAAINQVPGLLWRCSDCQRNCLVVNNAELTHLIDSKLNESLSQLKNKFESLYTMTAQQNASNKSTSYADMVKNKTYPAVIVKPKNTEQSIENTKAEILQTINPAEVNIRLSKVRTVKNGGLVIGCQTEEENEKFMSLVQNQLANSYDVQAAKIFKPRVRLVGMSIKYTEAQITDFIFKCNSHIFFNDAHVQIIKIFPLKNNSNIFQATIQLDEVSYNRVLQVGNICIGYDSCKVYDAVDVYRCFKCNEFNHSSKKCKNQQSCPICSGNHELKDCQSTQKKCSNCIKHNNKFNTKFPTDHAVWDSTKCNCYKHLKNKAKNDCNS